MVTIPYVYLFLSLQQSLLNSETSASEPRKVQSPAWSNKSPSGKSNLFIIVCVSEIKIIFICYSQVVVSLRFERRLLVPKTSVLPIRRQDIFYSLSPMKKYLIRPFGKLIKSIYCLVKAS